MYKYLFHKIMPITLAVALTGCATFKPVATTPNDIRSQTLEDSNEYRIEMKNKYSVTAPATQIKKDNSYLHIMNKEGQTTSSIPIDEISTLESKKMSQSYWLTGMGVGAGAGLVAGIVSGVVLRKDCNNASDPGDCKTMNNVGTVLSVVGGPIIGGAIGSLIGLAIPKTPKIVATPTVTIGPSGDMLGAELGVCGNF